MPTAKKTTARKPKPEKVEEPKGPEVEGFEVVEYEGLDMLDCERCEFNTFDLGSAKAHHNDHERADEEAQTVAELTENLASHAQLEVADE